MRIVFMGTPEFSVPTLQALAAVHEVVLVVTRPDRPRGRFPRPAPPPVKTAAEALGLRAIQPERMSDPAVREALRAAAPELMAVVAFGHILKPEILGLAPCCVNAHASLLPKYRGAAPIPWAIAHGETKTGITTILMSERMDAGDILLQHDIPISPDDTAGSLHDKLAPLAAELMLETISGLVRGTITPTPQDESQATYVPLLKKEDGRMDWTMPAERLALRVRAFDPWPGTYTFYREEQLKVLRASPEETAGGEPGTVLRAGKEGILVAAGAGALRLLEVQPAGKKRMTAAQFLAGHPLAAGSKFER